MEVNLFFEIGKISFYPYSNPLILSKFVSSKETIDKS
jgi:hypothetical protein